jgi:hypothetical protein
LIFQQSQSWCQQWCEEATMMMLLLTSFIVYPQLLALVSLIAVALISLITIIFLMIIPIGGHPCCHNSHYCPPHLLLSSLLS